MRFPLFGSAVLLSLFLAFKFLPKVQHLGTWLGARLGCCKGGGGGICRACAQVWAGPSCTWQQVCWQPADRRKGAALEDWHHIKHASALWACLTPTHAIIRCTTARAPPAQPQVWVNALLTAYIGTIATVVLANAMAPYFTDCFPASVRTKTLFTVPAFK